MSKLVIGGATLNQIPLDWLGNLKNIKDALSAAREQKVQILNLPELCIPGYGCEDMFLSDWVCEKSLNILGQIVPLTESMFVVVGLPLKFKGQIYNAICLIHDQQIQGFYCKHHLAKEGVHYEPRWFESWPIKNTDSYEYQGQNYPIGDISIELHDIRIGFEICEDAWREQRPADKFKGSKVDLILNPSASHFAFGKADFRENLVVDSSKKYDCYYLYTNLLGNEAGRMIFDGDIILAGKGRLIQRNKRLSFQTSNLITADIDFQSGDINVEPLNEWFSSQNEEFTAAASLALFDYLRKSRSQGFVLSLSGGADSSTCAVLVAEMVQRGIDQLGQEQFIDKLGLNDLAKIEEAKGIVNNLLSTAYQGTKNSSKETLSSAKELADSIGAKFHHWNIDDQVSLYTREVESALGRRLTWEKDDITLQNIQARARSPIIWMMANINNALLLTTSNRSEGDVGYSTMDGDTSGSLAPIAAIDKPFVLQWLKWAEEELDYTGLKKVNQLQPSAELRPADQSQTDEDDLMPYERLLMIERLAIKLKKSPKQIYKTLSTEDIDQSLLKTHIKKFFRLWARNQWKRERTAPSFHFDDFNIDPRSWMRFPILSSGFEEELKELEQL